MKKWLVDKSFFLVTFCDFITKLPLVKLFLVLFVCV